MKIAVASLGIVPDALVGIRFGFCSQFLVFDLDTMSHVVVSVLPAQEPAKGLSLEAIRAIAKQDVAAVITGDIKDICRQTLLELGIEVISGVSGMTVIEAIERYKSTRLATPESRKGTLARIAVAASGEGLEANLIAEMDSCRSFAIVDPSTKKWELVRAEHRGPAHKVNIEGVRAIVQSGASVVITSRLSPACCMALQALSVAAYIAPKGTTVREAIELYERGELEEVGPAI
jgi:predicted Fe-Mo cluster-binding NifX family protein